MPFELRLPKSLKTAGWKVKIFDKEQLEPPHVTVLRGPDEWRIGLRDGKFLNPPGGSWGDLPKGLQQLLRQSLSTLRTEWDRMHPTNPIGGQNG